MHEVLVNRLGGLSLPRKRVVILIDRPDMTLDVYRGRKTKSQQQHIPPLPYMANFSMKYFIWSKVYTDSLKFVDYRALADKPWYDYYVCVAIIENVLFSIIKALSQFVLQSEFWVSIALELRLTVFSNFSSSYALSKIQIN